MTPQFGSSLCHAHCYLSGARPSGPGLRLAGLLTGYIRLFCVPEVYGILFFIVVIWPVRPASALNWDARALKFLNRHYSAAGNRWVDGLENSVLPLAVAAPLGMWGYSQIAESRVWYENAMNLALAEGAAYGAAFFLKVIVDRDRPYQRYGWVKHPGRADDPAFPSGHATGSFVLAAALSLQFQNRWVSLASFTWASAVAVGRVYQGMHYPSDVLAGAALGGAMAVLVHHYQPAKWLLKERAIPFTGEALWLKGVVIWPAQLSVQFQW